MTEEQARIEAARRFLEKADRALAAARRELAAGDLDLAMNRAYYACFYAVTAALLREGRQFARHAGVRAALHRDLVYPGRLGAEFGRIYDAMFEARQEADYAPLVEFEATAVSEAVRNAEQLVAELRRIVGNL